MLGEPGIELYCWRLGKKGAPPVSSGRSHPIPDGACLLASADSGRFIMRVRWRGLELPSHVVTDPKFKSDVFGRFTVEPFEPGGQRLQQSD
jgi:hypothetical protein